MTSTAPPATYTTKPYAHWATASSASCTAAYATARSTTNTPPGHTVCQPPLDTYEPGMSNRADRWHEKRDHRCCSLRCRLVDQCVKVALTVPGLRTTGGHDRVEPRL